MKKITGIFTIVMLIALMTGCSNTFDGAGRDMKNAGQWMEDTF